MIDCCISAHGRGLIGVDADTLRDRCAGEACDSDRYLSARTALCAAQAHGLAPGIAECSATFSPADETGTAFAWTAWNVTERACLDGEWGWGSGDTVTLDAVTGAFLYSGAYAE